MNWKQETEGLIDIIEIYYKKGGYSELPNEVINDIESTLEEQTEEIERLNNIIKTKDEGFKALTEELCETVEENENLKEVIETIKRTNLLLIKQKAESEDNLYMLDKRIDKAIEYIKDYACYEEDTKQFCKDLLYSECLELLNILKGEDK